MSKQGHTPGPWSQDKYGSVRDVIGESIQFRGVSTLCSGPDERIAEAEANTRLIAAAPELLEALEAVIADFNQPGPEMDFDWIESAKEAIAKARGEA